MSEQSARAQVLSERGPTRRDLLRAVAGAAALGLGGTLAGCVGGNQGGPSPSPNTGPAAELRRGGTLRVGVVGAGGKDTLDTHVATVDSDQARTFNLYDRLVERGPDFDLEMGLAESIEPNKAADAWTIRLRDGVTFHDGKSLTSDDVIFTLNRILDPDDPKIGATPLSYVDAKRMRKLDRRTVLVPLKSPNVAFPDDLVGYWMGVVPEGFDPRSPVGTGPFKYRSFTAGRESVFERNGNYWRSGEPYLDALHITNLDDDTARVNAFLSGQVDAISSLPTSQVAAIEGNANLRVLKAKTGIWKPLFVRVDVAPFTDVRVRQALRLIPDREEMLQQALGGHGRVGNDLFAIDDPCYNRDLPQRTQDIDQARSLLKQAGQEDLRLELVCSPVSQGMVESATVFAEQAKAAGVNIRLRKVDTATFYGENYLKWPFSQDYWFPRTFLAQAALTHLGRISPWNQIHMDNSRFTGLVESARRELDENKRCEIIHEAQQFLFENDGYINWAFADQIDGYSPSFGGFKPSKAGYPLGQYTLRTVGRVA